MTVIFKQESEEGIVSTDVHHFNLGDEQFVFEPETLAIRWDKGTFTGKQKNIPPPLNPATIQPLRSISLAVSQACNMACSYCYASEGGFGGRAQLMDKVVAFAAIQQLIESTPKGNRVNIAFMGGEPMLNHKLIHQATRYAVEKGKLHGVKVDFSLTSNGILIRQKDIDLFHKHQFSITISIDGTEKQQNRQRPLVNGAPSYTKVIDSIQPLLQYQDKMFIGARVTVRGDQIDLPAAMENLREVGFRDIGFSPLLSAPSGKGELNGDDFSIYLSQMKQCGDEALQRLKQGKHIEFSNLKTALQEIHHSTPKSHPCGAGNDYVGVGADANMYLCHRYINDPKGRIGDLLGGIDMTQQQKLVDGLQVKKQLGCSQCWARHLCGGGCYHEVQHRGRPSCELIRGWLDYCLKAYLHVRITAPHYFGES